VACVTGRAAPGSATGATQRLRNAIGRREKSQGLAIGTYSDAAVIGIVRRKPARATMSVDCAAAFHASPAKGSEVPNAAVRRRKSRRSIGAAYMRASVSGAPGRVSRKIKCDGEFPQSTTRDHDEVAVAAPRQIAAPAANRRQAEIISGLMHTCHERGGLTGQRAEKRDAQHAAGLAGSS